MPNTPTRRTLLAATGATLASASFAGCLGGSQLSADAAEEKSQTTTTDSTSVDTTIQVGPDGELMFEPAEITVTPGTTIQWVWKSDRHNIIPEEQPSDAKWKGTPGGAGKLYGTGYTYTHTFTTEGHYEYQCTPHKMADMVGEITVSKPGGSTSVDAPTGKTATADNLPIEVGPNDEYIFSPGTDCPLVISAGTEVEFVWKSDGHNIVVEDQPADANWHGTPGSTSRLFDSGYTYSHTFEVPGRYDFTSQPFEAAGMVGTIYVE
ncbi:plastocyanin/azurin family copper-binding protein [Haladaptatus sp. DYF46]|uniref:plastocyanin/azurin family copper-binding protein n=1 Tax=Haladaptatus sp. DYF46 TaxID=2886041 RepID=UPI001E598F09|nr:plastocyanin/azurin family copper-binding protein [Haladaptatus sp. DYF46]